MSFWACAQLETHRERLALHFLNRNGFTTYCPRIRGQRSSREGERSTWLFPGYTFVAIALQWHAARWCPGIVELILDDLKSRERNGLIVLPPPPHLQRGDQVRILRGPFAGHLAIYDGMRPRERVVVLLTLLGAVQRVELAKRDVVVAPR
jgi:transcriptional antiterminator RfaH